MYNQAIFKELNKEESEKLVKIFEEKNIPKDTLLIKEGEIGNSAFLLLKGKISITKETMYGEDYVVTIIEGGGDEFFGEVNLIDEGKRTSSVRTVEDSVILEVQGDKLKNFMDNNKEIGYKIMWYMAKSCANHLRKADNDLLTLFNALVEVVEND